jgi:hypothetical protein
LGVFEEAESINDGLLRSRITSSTLDGRKPKFRGAAVEEVVRDLCEVSLVARRGNKGNGFGGARKDLECYDREMAQGFHKVSLLLAFLLDQWKFEGEAALDELILETDKGC